MLCKFIVEAKQRSGEPYSPKTLLQLLVNLQSYASDQNPAASNFMDSKDQQSLKEAARIGAKKKQARVVTKEEEEILWEKGVVMGTHSPTAFQNALFFIVESIFVSVVE